MYVKVPRIGALSDPFEWWVNHAEELPTLTRMALDYLAIPSSSLAPERANSRARQLWEDRSQLSDDVFRMEICMLSWYEHKLDNSEN